MVLQNIPKENIRFSLEQKKIRPTRRLVQISILTSGLGILDIEAQLNSLKIKWIQRLSNPNNALWKDFMLYQLNLTRNYNQDLALFKQKQILRFNSHKHLQKQNNEDIFIHVLIAWLHFISNNFPTPTCIKEILYQPVF